ncbi:MAG TPA: dipicolinate synthase subunit B [Syntrophomonadaceae bacterium]|nr:dipicolinate synthase subunit B [Syntrophomonadaceae bacterium]
MNLKGIRLGFVVTGSHCTMGAVFNEITKLVQEGAEVYPIVSYSISTTDTRFGKSSDLCAKLQEITGHEPIKTIVDAEPIGPNKLFDILVVAPCTGNTLAKLANGITDTPALMAIKAHLRNQLPVVIAVSTNDGLGLNAKNIATLLNTKNIYLVPFGQDNPSVKPNSLVAHLDKMRDTVCLALEGKQIQPVLLQY